MDLILGKSGILVALAKGRNFPMYRPFNIGNFNILFKGNSLFNPFGIEDSHSSFYRFNAVSANEVNTGVLILSLDTDNIKLFVIFQVFKYKHSSNITTLRNLV
jgi:hypothetical protein